MGARKCPGSCGKWFGSRGVPRKPWSCPNPECSAHIPVVKKSRAEYYRVRYNRKIQPSEDEEE